MSFFKQKIQLNKKYMQVSKKCMQLDRKFLSLLEGSEIIFFSITIFENFSIDGGGTMSFFLESTNIFHIYWSVVMQVDQECVYWSVETTESIPSFINDFLSKNEKVENKECRRCFESC